MRYIDLSFKKIFWICLLIGILLGGVGVTFLTKQHSFGSTPFFPALGLWLEKSTQYITYSLERSSLLHPLASGGLFSSVPRAYASPQEKAVGIPVLVYHRVLPESSEILGAGTEGFDVDVKTFKDQMYALKDAGWQTITLKEFEAFMKGELELPEKSVLITFDDGTKDSYYPTDSLFKVLGFNAVSYIILKDTERKESTYYLSPEEIRKMLGTERWEIGSHSNEGHEPYPIDAAGTMGHFFSDKLFIPEKNRTETPAEFAARIKNDLLTSKTVLEKTYGVSINTFAFPFGDYGQDTTNFPNAEKTTLEEASRTYSLGFVQNHSGEYTFNYPHSPLFTATRLEVKPSWSGAELLSVLEKGKPKSLPYTANFNGDSPWLQAWGSVSTGNGVLELKATPTVTGATALLDGSYPWSAYTITTTMDWRDDYAVLLVGTHDDGSSRACVFFNGSVRLQARKADGSISVIDEVKNPRIAPGTNRVLGAQVTTNSVSCLWNGNKVLGFSRFKPRTGGVGIEVWGTKTGEASLVVKEISVTKPEY